MSLTNFIRLPKNLSSIAKPDAFRNYCLNPLGLQTKKTSNFPKQQRIYSFLNIPLTVHRAEKELNNNTIQFKVQPRLTKPEIKQYLEKVYGLEVKRVHTANTMGKIKRNFYGKKYRYADYKKASVILRTPVEQFYQKVQE